METKNFKTTPVVNFSNVSNTIKNIEKFVVENNYQFKEKDNLGILESYFNIALQQLSKKKRKRLANYMWRNDNHPTLKSVNVFFHFLMKVILKSDLRVRVILSAREIAIQEKRKAYKEAIAKVKQAYADYKEEKGDFYNLILDRKKRTQL